MYMESLLLPVISVPFLFAAFVMNMSGRMATNLARNARRDTSGTKVCQSFILACVMVLKLVLENDG